MFVTLTVLFAVPTRSIDAQGHAQLHTLIDLGTLGGLNSGAVSINKHDQVVGASQIDGNASFHAFSWKSTVGMIDLGTLGGSESSAVAVNDQCQVAGDSTLADSSNHAFSWTSEDGIIDLGTLGGPSSHALALNNPGQIVGQSLLAYPNGYHASRGPKTEG